jgi:B9 domain-containing protein 2
MTTSIAPPTAARSATINDDPRGTVFQVGRSCYLQSSSLEKLKNDPIIPISKSISSSRMIHKPPRSFMVEEESKMGTIGDIIVTTVPRRNKSSSSSSITNGSNAVSQRTAQRSPLSPQEIMLMQKQQKGQVRILKKNQSTTSGDNHEYVYHHHYNQQQQQMEGEDEDQHEVKRTGAHHKYPSFENNSNSAPDKKQQHLQDCSSSSLLQLLPPTNCSHSSIRGNRDRYSTSYHKPMIVADYIPEVHFIGEIQSGYGFNGHSVTCKWSVHWGTTWSLLEGSQQGQTQFAMNNSDNKTCVWNHPIDLHFTTANMKGWPRIVMQVWKLDAYGTVSVIGYGFTHFPATPGIQEIQVKCWRPKGTIAEEIRHFFLGTSIPLTQDRIIFEDAWENRHRLATILSGDVKLRISSVMRYFEEQSVL